MMPKDKSHQTIQSPNPHEEMPLGVEAWG